MPNDDKNFKKLVNKASRLPGAANDLKIQQTLNRIREAKGLPPQESGRRETHSEQIRRQRRQQNKNKKSLIPDFNIIDTPSWFTNNEEVDVSIIIPMYKSRKVIENQIKKWNLDEDGLKKEIIYVDDACPMQSHEIIIPAWESRRQFVKSPIGKIIVSDSNRGYAKNCNLGAKFAKGKYLIFLNADVTVLPNWVKPLYDLLENNKNIGIVGNLQVKNNEPYGLVDSAGSQWMWQSGHFEHIGKTCYQGKSLSKPFKNNEIPEDLNIAAPREMVTGCCFMIPKSLFMEIGGYDESYKIGYWEDADMCMAVKEKGYQVYYEPNSKIVHMVGHTQSAGHPYMKDNKQRFYRRWVESGFLNNVIESKKDVQKFTDLKSSVKGEVVGCVIACNEEEFLEASVRSIASICSKFILVIGGNEYAYQSGMCNEKGLPNDTTLEIAHRLSKEYGGLVVEPPGRLWKGKAEMRNAYAKHMLPGQYCFTLDGDEVYKPGNLWVISGLMQKYECIRMQYYLFWNNLETIGVGAWENYPQERIVKWKEGYHYSGKNHLSVSDKNGKEIAYRVPTYEDNEKLFYHYSWVRSLHKIEQKIKYYENQLKYEWGQPQGVIRDYYNDVFLKWRQEPKGILATHPRGGGETCKFAGIHPVEVQNLIKEGKLNF